MRKEIVSAAAENHHFYNVATEQKMTHGLQKPQLVGMSFVPFRRASGNVCTLSAA